MGKPNNYMIKKKNNLTNEDIYEEEPIFSGIYGSYTITSKDKREVQFYRLSVLLSALAFFIGLTQWIFIGPNMVWIWLMLMAIGLGAALKWIHIYLETLHKGLQILWALGCLGIVILVVNVGAENLLATFSRNTIWTIAIGPLFAALTGLGFKEFFCFRRPEAIGLTLLIPIALLGHLSQLLNGKTVMTMLMIASFLSLVLAIRKFGMDAASDVGDKSVFEFLDNQKTAKVT